VARRTWILDTSTKGTGAQMVPLENVLQKGPRSDEPVFVPHEVPPREPAPAEPPAPKRFKLVDIVTREVLAEGVGVREALTVLGDVHSIVDVRGFVWQPKAERWRMLTLEELRLLWDRRGAQERGRSTSSATP
jgi:hypothetical protein